MSDKEILEKNEQKRTLCEIWSRVMGYFRPRSQYNKGKTQEAKDRKYFKIDERFTEEKSKCSCEENGKCEKKKAPTAKKKPIVKKKA